jgi:phosphoglycolate phosphatase
LKTGILFDLDGTLLDTLEDLKDAVNYTLSQYDCPLRSLDEVRTFVGTGAANLIRKALPGKANDPSLEEALAVYQKYYAAHAQDKTAPYEGIADALKTVCARYPVAIVSNKPDPAVKLLAAEFFPGVYALGETPEIPRKPAPDMLLKAMQDLGVDHCVYVGDSDVDVITAAGVGAACASVLWGFRDEPEIRAAGGAYFCHRVEDLPALIEMLAEKE